MMQYCFKLLLFFRNTLTNLSVLVDVLNVAHNKKYLSLDPVSQHEVPPKPAVRLLSKRKVREKDRQI